MLRDPARTRIIKVRLDGGSWGTLTAQGTQELLQWYDSAQLMDVKTGVITNDNGHSYDYRIEGGKYLSQNNPNFPDTPPRECQILYHGCEPADDEPGATGAVNWW